VTLIYGFSKGALGIDTNPDGLAVETDKSGNMIRHQYLGSQRILFARHDKRRHDIEALAVQVVNQAVMAEKGLNIEDLKFISELFLYICSGSQNHWRYARS
jgi:hypothetical protein